MAQRPGAHDLHAKDPGSIPSSRWSSEYTLEAVATEYFWG